jgi:hypothetical protein
MLIAVVLGAAFWGAIPVAVVVGLLTDGGEDRAPARRPAFKLEIVEQRLFEAAAVGSLITFGTAGIYVAFLLIALAALIARVRGTWKPAGRVQLGRLGLMINTLAVLWLAFETVNIAWPRESLAPAGAPAYQVWAAPLVLALIAAVGLAYLQLAKPQRASGRAE